MTFPKQAPDRPPGPSGPVAPFHLMAKPVGPRCNLACRYCFYSEKEALFGGTAPRMSRQVLEAYIRRVAEEQPGPELQYSWQGGEPALAGLDFFREAVDLQKRYAEGRPVSNAFQTNGVLLDDAWCEFFAREGFLVGLSLDGPGDAHDPFRVDHAGRGTHARVMAVLARLLRHGVAVNTLTCVHAANAGAPRAVYRFLREAGVEHIQLIPLVERKITPEAEALGLSLGTPPEPGKAPGRQALMPWCAAPAEIGNFFCGVFDEWIRADVGRIFVQLFEVAAGAWIGGQPGLCHFAETCGRALVVEANGEVYACDHFVYPAYRRGNLATDPLVRLVEDPDQVRFGEAKRTALPESCLSCRFRFACGGGCPKHRFRKAATGGVPENALCAAYLRFFRHADPWLRILSDLLRRGLPAAGLMEAVRESDLRRGMLTAKRNDPCPCGSGRKFKACCGRQEGARDAGRGGSP